MHISLPRPVRQAARGAADRLSSPIGSVLRFRGNPGVVSLTFDDGPDPDVTPRLLRVLERADARATFFMLVSRVRRFPGIAQDVAAAGHEIALHGLDHRRLTRLTPAEALDSITVAKTELQRSLDADVRWFRPPYGAHDFRIWRHVRSLGMQLVLWGPSLHDWTDMTPEERWTGASAGSGDIVLGHDGLAGAWDAVDDQPPPALDRADWAGQVLARYRDQGLRSRTLSEASSTGRAVRGARWTQ